MSGYPWAPTLAGVARHIPTRTRDKTVPGSDTLLGTFTANTTPTDSQAQSVIDDVVASLVAVTGDIPATAEIEALARVAAEWRAAADIEIAYPNRNADVRLYDQLDDRAAGAFSDLKVALSQAGSGLVEANPEWQMPLAPAWGDTSPGSGADYQMGPY